MDQELTTRFELVSHIKKGNFFYFCVCFALNKGFCNAMKGDGEVKFTVGDYDVEFKKDQMAFVLSHKVYFARIIMTDPNGTSFVGNTKKEVIKELLTEFNKEPDFV